MRTRSLPRAAARGAGCWVLGAALAVAGCKATDTSATSWEIVHGTSTVVAAKAVDTATYAQIVAFTGAGGTITVADDSSLAGSFKLAAADSQDHFTGSVSFGDSALMALSGITPWKYRLITSSAYPDTYGLVSDTVLTKDLVGDSGLEHYRLYWELHR